MKEYPKIQSIFKRDPNNNFKTFIMGDYSIPEFEYLKDNEWIFTEKVDGTNIRVLFECGEITFKGKTDNADIPPFLLKKLKEIFDDKDKWYSTFNIKMDNVCPKICLYGEGYGAKIQKGGGNYISNGVDFVLFDVKIDDWWLLRDDVKDIASKFNLKVVPFIGMGTLQEAVDMAKKGFMSQWGNFNAEGIVMKPSVQLFARNGDRIIAKVKTKDFRKEGK